MKFYHRKQESTKTGQEHTCHCCGKTIEPNEYFGRKRIQFRATCWHMASHAGTWYPTDWISVCESCMTPDEKQALNLLK